MLYLQLLIALVTENIPIVCLRTAHSSTFKLELPSPYLIHTRKILIIREER